MLNRNFKSILELLEAFPDEQSCIDHLTELRWNGNVVSPFDPTSKVYVCKDNKYRCKNTGKYFNVRTATLFDNSKIELRKWMLAIYLITAHKKGISSLQLGRDLNVTQKTSWFMLHRIRNCFGIDAAQDLEGTVEADETFVGGKNKNRHKNKKTSGGQGGLSEDKTPVVGLIQRDGKVKAKVTETVDRKTLHEFIISNVKTGTTLMTDERKGYRGLTPAYTHFAVNHALGEYVNGSCHTNTMEGFWSLFKRGIIGIYHFASEKHLQKYVDESVFRYNTRSVKEHTRMNLMLSNTEHRLTYQNLIK